MPQFSIQLCAVSNHGKHSRHDVTFPNHPVFPTDLFDAKENMFPVEVASMGVGLR